MYVQRQAIRRLVAQRYRSGPIAPGKNTSELLHRKLQPQESWGTKNRNANETPNDNNMRKYSDIAHSYCRRTLVASFNTKYSDLAHSYCRRTWLPHSILAYSLLYLILQQLVFYRCLQRRKTLFPLSISKHLFIAK